MKEKSPRDSEGTRIYHDIMKQLYKDGDIRSEDKLKCWKSDCFNDIEKNKLLELDNEKQHFLENTKNILKHIQVDNNTQYSMYDNDSSALHFI